MKITTGKLLGLGLGAAALCATALPAAAGGFTAPGSSTAVPAGANPPPGLYFANTVTWGSGGSFNNVTPTPGESGAVGAEVPAFIYVPGWNFLGATYAAAVALPFVEVGIHQAGVVGTAGAAPLYLRGVGNPAISPVTLSWNLGNGFFVSIGENIYIPNKAEFFNPEVVTNPFTGARGGVQNTSAAAFEQKAAISYLANDWVISANGLVGIATNDSDGNKSPDYVNIDGTVGHTFGKWQLGVVGYYAADIEDTALNAFGTGHARDEEAGIGGYLGYNFGPVDLTIQVKHELISKGAFLVYGVHETRATVGIVIPIWNPTPPAPPRPVVAKY
jgi:hypothetical protein